MMSEEKPFTSAHIRALAKRAAELERIGEERQDPHALVRAARLYTLAVRIADDIDNRDALPFMQSDLARVRDELRTLATDGGRAHRSGADSTGGITRMFREVAERIAHRLARDAAPSRQI